jgi:hypothetical protein
MNSIRRLDAGTGARCSRQEIRQRKFEMISVADPRPGAGPVAPGDGLRLTAPNDGVLVVALNDPVRRNPVSTPMIEQLVTTLTAVDGDDAVRALVLT